MVVVVHLGCMWVCVERQDLGFLDSTLLQFGVQSGISGVDDAMALVCYVWVFPEAIARLGRRTDA